MNDPFVEKIARALYPVAFQFKPGHRRREQALKSARVAILLIGKELEAMVRAETEKT